MSESRALIESLYTLSRPRVEGDRVRFEITRADAETDSYSTRLHAVPLAARPDDVTGVRRVSTGWSDRAYTRKGSVTAFLRAPQRQSPQLWVAVDDGPPRAVTDLPLGITEYVLSEDGTQAYAIARDPEQGRYGTDPDVTADGEPPRRITTLTYQSNGVGYVLDRPARLLRVPLEDEADPAPAGEVPLPSADEVLRLAGDVHDLQVDHGRVSVIGPTEAPGTRPDLRSTVWIATDDAPYAVDVGDLSVASHAWMDPHRIALLATDVGPSRTDFVAQVPGLHIHDVRNGTTHRLTPVDHGELSGELLAVDDRVLCLLTDDGAERLAEVSTADDVGEDDRIRALTPVDWAVTGFDRTADDAIVVTAATPDSCGEVFRLGPASAATGGDPHPIALTALDGRAWYRARPIAAQTSGGEVRGWCAIPAGTGPHPVVLSIHGGPFAQYTAAAFDEVQALLDAGVAVVWSNPRGSAGRGRAWGARVRGDFADPASEDVLAVLVAALEAHPQLDSRRLGVQGGSYGGYLTAMIIADDHRFTGAIVERGFLDPVSFAGTSDIGGFFGHEYVGSDPADLARQSPLARVGDVRTPTLVIHSEKDLRCPLEQAQQYYAGLLRHGVEAELLVFPGEDHELSRSGRPRHRIARFEAIADWWSRLFGTGPAPGAPQDG
ncbi:S9 family peptidase [Brevibacterium yomogidense]|uniref:S9 family peptidase n=1 Tax=Brevibacterium yomogidense TaxID=946573 RepID=UPI0018DF4DD2|nr:prolyl oligopeptidase family serine peptidase [Brevibacterium yomogidense]